MNISDVIIILSVLFVAFIMWLLCWNANDFDKISDEEWERFEDDQRR